MQKFKQYSEDALKFVYLNLSSFMFITGQKILVHGQEIVDSLVSQISGNDFARKCERTKTGQTILKTFNNVRSIKFQLDENICN